jgi:hypothetical protein
MRIEFRKAKIGKVVLYCEREDGSSTWAELLEGSGNPRVVVPHDLVHYVVETVLGLDNAFFGFIERGLDLHASLCPEEKRAMRSEPAVLRAEAAVATLHADFSDGPFDDEMRAAKLKDACAGWRVAPFEISREEWDSMRAKLEELGAAWVALPRGQQLELVFTTRSDVRLIREARPRRTRQAVPARA